jgi:ankyrin repeat protein
MSTIHDLVRNHQVQEVKSYLESGKDINIIDKHSRTPLHLAAWSGFDDIIALLLAEKRTKIDVKAMDGFSPLHFAVQSNNKDPSKIVACIRLLCEDKRGHGLLSERITKGNKTVLHLAVVKGLPEVIKVLLDYGVDTEAKTSQGQTAIDLAKTSEIRELLSSHVSTTAKKNEITTTSAKGADNEEVMGSVAAVRVPKEPLEITTTGKRNVDEAFENNTETQSAPETPNNHVVVTLETSNSEEDDHKQKESRKS